MTVPYLAPPRPRLFAHRGASAHYPENTLPAFAAAVEAGITYLEMDVRATRDGVIVVHHDETLRRTCGVERPLSACTLAELLECDAGFGFTADGGATFPHRGREIIVPTLSAVLAAFPAAFCNIELKQDLPGVEKLLLDTLRRAGAEQRVLLAAEQDRIMERLRPLCGAIPTSLSFGESAAFFAWLQGGRLGDYRPPGVALQIPVRWGERELVTAASVAGAHAAGLEVHVWTVNEEMEMERLLALGVDGLMSDYPQRLLAVAGRQPVEK
jgi:glycerophosphoryl diester phosphodiesterase